MKYKTILAIYKMTDRELVEYRKELLERKTQLESELKYKLRGCIAEAESELQGRIRRLEHDLAEAQHDRENCLSSGYNEAMLSIN